MLVPTRRNASKGGFCVPRCFDCKEAIAFICSESGDADDGDGTLLLQAKKCIVCSMYQYVMNAIDYFKYKDLEERERDTGTASQAWQEMDFKRRGI